jgi:chromosome segregation ATPase
MAEITQTEFDAMKARAEKAESKVANNKAEIAKLKADFETFKTEAEKTEMKNEPDAETTKKLAEYEALGKRAADAETRLRTLETEKLFGESAGKLKAKNSTKLFSLIGSKIEFDASGKPTNVDAVLNDAKTSFPEEFGLAVGGGSSTSIGGGAKGDEVGKSVDDFLRGALS